MERLKGQVIKVSQNSTQYINPMDINLNYSEGDTPIALKSDFILSFCELIMGGKNGLEAVEKTLIDRAVISVYRNYLADPKPENMPILGDLYDEIKKQPEKEAQRIAAALELYVNGSLNVFNHRTNVDIHNRLVCFDIKELGTQLTKSRYAHCPRPSLEQSYDKPQRGQGDAVLHRRVSFAAQRGTDRSVQR